MVDAIQEVISLEGVSEGVLERVSKLWGKMTFVGGLVRRRVGESV